MLIEHQTTKPEGILKLLLIIPNYRNCEIVVWNFMEKMTNLEKLWINWQFTFSWTEFYELFDDKPCQSLSAAKA